MRFRVVLDHDTKLRVVTVIGTGIIIKGIHRAMTNSAD
jgi:hypothetical protein